MQNQSYNTNQEHITSIKQPDLHSKYQINKQSIKNSTHHQKEKQQSASTHQKKKKPQIRQINKHKSTSSRTKNQPCKRLTGGVSLNGVHKISMPKIPVILAKLHLVEMLLRSHGQRKLTIFGNKELKKIKTLSMELES